MKANSGNLSIPKNSQSRVVRKRRMTNHEQLYSDILAWPNISSMELSQTTTIVREDDVKDFNDDDIGTKMNKQVLLEDLSPTKTIFNDN